MTEKILIEKLAEKQHEIWSHWMKWMFENGGEQDFFHGPWVMDATKRMRWEKQTNTPYAELTEKEKQSDRDVIIEHKLLDLVSEAMNE